MTNDTLPLAELMQQKAGGDDFLRAVAEAVLQLLSRSDPSRRDEPRRRFIGEGRCRGEADVEGVIGAGRHEHSVER